MPCLTLAYWVPLTRTERKSRHDEQTMRQLRHGDVLLEQMDTIPESAIAVPPTGGKNVLALGKQSGHAHVLDAPYSTLYEAQNPDERFLEVLEDGGLLTHEEHGAIHLAPGTYRVIAKGSTTLPRSGCLAGHSWLAWRWRIDGRSEVPKPPPVVRMLSSWDEDGYSDH